MATIKDAAEGGTFGFVILAMGWIANQLRRTTKDTESRAGRTVTSLEADIVRLRTEVGACRDQHEADERRMARLERALILADIELPP